MANIDISITAKDYASKEFKKIQDNMKGVNTQIDDINKKTSTFGDTFKAIGAYDIAKNIGSQILQLGKHSINLAANFEQTRISFETMLGDGEKAGNLLQQLSDFAATTPFEFPEIANAGKSLLAFGFEAEKIQGNLRILGDIASGLNIPFGELSDIYGKIRVQGRLYAEDINQLTGRGIPIIGELAKQFGITEGEVKKLVESGKLGFPEIEEAFKSLTAEGSQFGGMMEKQSQTLTGVMSTIKDQMNNTLMEIIGINQKGEIEAGSIFENIKIMSAELSSALNENQEEIQTALQNTIKVLSFVGKTIGFVIQSWYNFGGAVGFVIADIVIRTQKFYEDTVKIFGFIKDNVLQIGNDIYYGFIGFIDSLVAGITEKIEAVMNFVKEKVEQAKNLMATISSKVSTAYSNVGANVKTVLGLDGTRASGGPVGAGKTYLVGEKGPELFTPSNSGRITANNQLGGNMNININMGGVSVNNSADENRLVDKIKKAFINDAKLYNLGIN